MKTFYQDIDLSNRQEIINFLSYHFSYYTRGLYPAYANDLKIHHLDLNRKTEDKLWDMLDCENAYDSINQLIDDFAEAHDWRYQAVWHGRSGGYLVLHKGRLEQLNYKSVCTSCGQKNYRSVEETGCRCGNCGKETRRNLTTPLKQAYITGAVVPVEDFGWFSFEKLQELATLVLEFDRLCDDIVQEAIFLANNCEVEEEMYYIEQKRKVLV